MEEKKTLLTYSGLKQYQEELEYLKSVKRKEIADKLKVAREQGDLSENAEYDAAKDEQSDNEKRIEELEQLLKNVEVITDDDVDSDKVSVGTKVKIRDMEYKEDLVFDIVGTQQANSLEGKISNESPLGMALIGAKKNQTVTVDTPSGQIKYKILSVEKSDEFNKK
ncbi:MAG: transcription elongation factor GreA [Lachnospiraceae bacterium]|nr:transcription elongation factor GreA [Lachnospiraceae bacterium]